MAPAVEEDEAAIQVEDSEVNGVSKEKLREAKGVDSVTDYVTEKETTVDAAAATVALGSIDSAMQSKKQSSMKLSEEDIKVVMEECDMPKEAAEALLRGNDGVLKSALMAYVTGQT
mmetsp:Transcript_32535/g.46941  ORF Transcript_32535/g.46941 Transcript_32535/m.46941 type:complete len:116 (+) Transcript_32535:46-393(+)